MGEPWPTLCTALIPPFAATLTHSVPLICPHKLTLHLLHPIPHAAHPLCCAAVTNGSCLFECSTPGIKSKAAPTSAAAAGERPWPSPPTPLCSSAPSRVRALVDTYIAMAAEASPHPCSTTYACSRNARSCFELLRALSQNLHAFPLAPPVAAASPARASPVRVRTVQCRAIAAPAKEAHAPAQGPIILNGQVLHSSTEKQLEIVRDLGTSGYLQKQVRPERQQQQRVSLGHMCCRC